MKYRWRDLNVIGKTVDDGTKSSYMSMNPIRCGGANTLNLLRVARDNTGGATTSRNSVATYGHVFYLS
jgi:hypothetical protein